MVHPTTSVARGLPVHDPQGLRSSGCGRTMRRMCEVNIEVSHRAKKLGTNKHLEPIVSDKIFDILNPFVRGDVDQGTSWDRLVGRITQRWRMYPL